MNHQALSEWLVKLNSEVQRTNHCYPHNLVQGWPIPFFGDILHARVLTVGVNPSDKEFGPHRQWDVVTDAAQWQARLLSYFQNSEARPWIWFETWSMCLTLIELGYAGGGAAHIDVSPRPTTPMLGQATDAAEFRMMVERDAKWFFELLTKLPQIQLLLVAGPIPQTNGGRQQLVDFVREQAGAHGADWIDGEPLPKLVTSGHPNGIPVFVCPYEPGVDGLYAMVRQVRRNRDLLLRLSAPGIDAVPILPARLDWPSAIGNFLLNYGTLDYLVYVFLKDHLPPEEFARVKEWHFKDRVTKIAQHLREAKHPAEQQNSFARLLERLEPVRELRNHISHGHMHLRLDPETKAPTVTIFKAKDLDTGYLPGSKHVEFAELEIVLSTVNELIEEFQSLAGFKTDGCATITEDLKK